MALLWVGMATLCLWAQTPAPFHDDHESDQPAWRDGGGNCTHKILAQKRHQGGALTGNSYELLRIRCENDGNTAYLVYPISPIQVTRELLPSLGVRSTRSGPQMLVRIVLPHTLDPETGRSTQILLRGGIYSSIDHWQRLRVEGIANLLHQEICLRRNRCPNQTFSLRDAYLDAVILNVWSGPGDVDIGLDALEISGGLPAVVPTPATPPATAAEVTEGEDGRPTTPETGTLNKILLNQLTLTINNTPIFVRAIRWRGESLTFLSRMGFNTIWLPQPPTKEMESEARLLNLWFICPPPIPTQPQETDQATTLDPKEAAGQAYNRVLVWDMGTPPRKAVASSGRENTQIEQARQSRQWILGASESLFPNRPLLAAPDRNYRGFSSIYDILLLNRNPIASTQDFVSYGFWFRQMQNTVRVGRPLWAAIETQYPATLQAQWKPLATATPLTVPDTLPFEQLRLMTYSAIMAGSRGLLFESNSRLDAPDQETEYRMKSLSLVNLELLQLEQWISRGDSFTTLPSNIPHVVGAVLGIPYAQLLVPLCLEPQSQYVPGVLAERNVEFLVRGLPATYQCWSLTPDGLIPLPYKSRTGGVRVTLEELPLVSTIVMTQKPVIISSLSLRCTRFAPKMTQLMREVADLRLRYFLQFHGTTSLQGEEAQWYTRAKEFLEYSAKASQNRDYTEALMSAQRAMRPVELMERQLWRQRTAGIPSPNYVPTATAFRAMPLHEVWMKRMEGACPQENILPGGTFEGVETMVRAGWKHLQNDYEVPGVEAKANLVKNAAHSGSLGVQMEVLAKDPTKAPTMLETPAVRLKSPPVTVGPAGTFYQVEAWVNIPNKLVNAVDGLKITDSNSGDVLAERVTETNGWKKVVFQRVTPNDAPVTVEISLAGYGTAWVDDVFIYPLKQGSQP